MHKIGYVSKLLKLSTQAIRLYEKKGLISPSHIDENTGYRYYSDKDIDTLWKIQFLRGLGLSLHDIKNMNVQSIDNIRHYLEQRKGALEERIRKDSITLNALDQKIDSLNHLQDSDCNEGIYMNFPDRFGKAIPATDNRNIIEHTEIVNQIQGENLLHSDIAFQPSRILTFDEDNYTQLKFLCALNDKGITHAATNHTVTGGLYYCKKAVGLEGIQEIYRTMLENIYKDGYTIRGDALELLLLDTSIVGDSTQILREIQIPVIER